MGSLGKIVGAQRVLFLGAGASKPIGKMLMAEFVQKLHDSGPPAPELFNSICGKKRDLEFLIEQLEEIACKEYLADEKWDPTWIPGGGPERLKPKWPEFQILQRQAVQLIPWVKQQVFQHYREIVLSGLNQEKFSRLLGALALLDEPLVVFTTNYDPTIEEFCRLTKGWQLVDGFTNDPRASEYFWSRTAFDNFDMNPGEKTIVLFKLHGSTTWIRLGPRIVKSPPVYSGADPSFPNIIIYPATRKVAIEDPFFTAYDYLDKCLSEARFCLVVGYSFRDYDSLMRFKAAKLANRQLRIVVLDPHAGNLSKSLKQQGVDIEPLPFLFDQQETEYLPRMGELLK